MITKKEFYNLYNKNSVRNSSRKAGPIDAKIFLRDTSLPIAYWMAKKGIEANPVSMVFLVVGILANVSFAIPGIIPLAISFALHEVAQLIDCIDGQLARFNGSAFQEGEKLDTLITIIISGFFVLAFGLRLYFETGNTLFLILAGVGAFSKAFEHQLIVDKKTLLDQPIFKEIMNKSKAIRYSLYGIESLVTEVRLLVFVVLLIEIISMFTNVKIIVSIVFLSLIILANFENLLLRICLTYIDLTRAKKIAWKGWQ